MPAAANSRPLTAASGNSSETCMNLSSPLLTYADSHTSLKKEAEKAQQIRPLRALAWSLTLVLRRIPRDTARPEGRP
jgi:hypothetical protein